MRYEDFVLQLDAGHPRGFRARVLRSPFGEAATAFDLPFPGVDAASALAPVGLEFAEAGPVLFRGATEAEIDLGPGLDALTVGSGLYHSLFQGSVRTLFDKSRGQLEREPDLCLRLKIKLDPNDPSTSELADLPWELLYDEDVEDHFALRRQTTLIRYLDVPRPSQPIPFTPPLRILAVAASPSGLPELNLDAECARLEELERREPGVEVRFRRQASASTVREELSEGGFHVLHFMGHGDFDSVSGDGLLFFEGPNRTPERVSGRSFAARLRDIRTLGLVTLNACNTARALHERGQSPFRGVATALVLGGLPAVVAMQHPIQDDAAIGFSSTFYRHLARGAAIDSALTEGRQAIFATDPEGFGWAIPVLFLRVANGTVFEALPGYEQPGRLIAPNPREEEPQADPSPSPERLPEPPIRNEPVTEPPISRGRPVPKLAVAAGGAVLVTVGLYTGIHAWQRGDAKQEPAPQFVAPDQNGTTEAPAHPQPIAGDGKKTAHKPEAGPSSAPKETAMSSRSTEPAPKPDAHAAVPEPPSQTPASAPEPVLNSDPSALRASVVAFSPRGEGAWKVDISFTNTSSAPLSIVLDDEGSILSGGGQSYGAIGSDLPRANPGYRLTIAAGQTLRGSLNFPSLKLGTQKVTLSLATSEGKRIRVDGAAMTVPI